MHFIPDDDNLSDVIKIPYLEDAKADFAPFYSSNKSIKEATAEFEKEMAKLSASVLRIQSGKFEVNGKLRIGYQVEFSLHGLKGQLTIAALPIRNITPTKEAQARVQAILNMVQWVRSMVTQRVFSSGENPLTPYLLSSDGTPIIKKLEAVGLLRQLASSNAEVVEAEIE